MSGFVKIYGKILKSSVWVGQPAHLRLTWIALLVLADRKGDVYSSVPGLAQDAGVTIPEVLQALDAFQKPDPFSRTPDHEGRRIEEIDGGWHVLNHDKYREMRTETQVKNAERQAKFKAKRRVKAAPVAPVSAPVTSVTGNDGNALLCTLYSDPDQSLEDDPDPALKSPPKDPESYPRVSGVFDAPVLQAQPVRSFFVPDDWRPKERHVARCSELGLNLDDEVRRFRRHEFQRAWSDWDRRFDAWLDEARKRAETEAFQRQGPRKGRMPTNGVAQLQPDEGRTGFESLDLPEPEPERPRRAVRR